ncbi:hypothetical protein N7457_005210 [Penicillium paradoxum]|uniref:uncharacterized protein n=1 Tax=Penicillium paradoxum TaxID=176176 RepID=UPI0025469505|nr:uncharacterized protein N7457_005210 [Penicillium paradoxum]KAJ5780050.1 hypothetical protein N7457_005210 [Penicillium paradoxum]
MARLTDDGQDAASDPAEILSPQPFVPPGKGFLVSSLESSNETYHQENAQMTPAQMTPAQMTPAQDYEYNSSPSSARHSTSEVFGHEMDDELEQLKSRASSRSSLSSIPASVLIHPVDHMKQMPDMDIHEKIAGYRIEASEASFGDFNDIPANIRTIRQREAAFRKPSSVRAMQMHTEDEADDDDYLTPPRRRQGLRSPGSSPLKRSQYYSSNASKQPKPKKEAPLVLLHCTLLPPSLPVPGASDPRNQDILEDELPAAYWRRWRRLQDRVGSGVLRDRGVLISHPEDLYDMLEERLLESLELQRPRLQNGHFLGHDDHSSGSGSEGDFSDIGESETDGEQGEECPDCGTHVRHGDSNRKWEIRVFAANGLMRAGAWSAAWHDMEKVDVEVGLWLPSDVRRGLERRLAEAQMAVTERAQDQTSQMHMHMQISSLVNQDNQVPQDILESPRPSHARMISDGGSLRSDGMSFRQAFPEAQPQARIEHVPEFKHERKEHEVALSTLLVNYIRVLAADRRNIALVILSVLVAFLAFGSCEQPALFYPDLGSFSQSMSHDIPSSPAMSLSVTSSLSDSARSVISVEETNAPVLSSNDLLPSSKSMHAAQSETPPMSTETVESSYMSDGSSEPQIVSTESVEPTETTPSPLIEATQSQTEETAYVSSSSASAVEFSSIPEEALESTATIEPQSEGPAEASLADTVDSPTVSIESAPSSADYDEVPTLSDVYVETETSQSESATDYPLEIETSPAVSSESPFSSIDATIVSEETEVFTETTQSPAEATIETPWIDAVETLAAPAELTLSSIDTAIVPENNVESTEATPYQVEATIETPSDDAEKILAATAEFTPSSIDTAIVPENNVESTEIIPYHTEATIETPLVDAVESLAAPAESTPSTEDIDSPTPSDVATETDLLQSNTHEEDEERNEEQAY